MAARSRRRVARMRWTSSETGGGSNAKVPEAIQLVDVLCCVCRGLLVEPVSLPCRHRFCRACWLATDALRCPLCRTRVGSWLRESARRNTNLVDEELWRVIRDKFPEQLAKKLKGEDIDLPNEVPAPRLSAPGEIRAEYEAELQRLRSERLQLECQHSEETARLVRKLQEEEDEAHRTQLEKVKQDELLAKQLQAADKLTHVKSSIANGSLTKTTKKTPKRVNNKRTTIDRYLVRISPPKLSVPHKNPVIMDDCSQRSAASSNIEGVSASVVDDNTSPELVPSYGHFLQNYLDKNLGHLSGSMLPKDISGTVKTWVPPSDAKDANAQKEFTIGTKPPIRTKGAQKLLCPIPAPCVVQSVPVSLPYSGLLNQKLAALSGQASKGGAGETDSVDSMRQELCYFKPIQATQTTSRNKNEPSDAVRVPAVHGAPAAGVPLLPPPTSVPPDYLKGLRQLRGQLALQTPSAFVTLVKFLQGDAAACDISDLKSKAKKTVGDGLDRCYDHPKSSIKTQNEGSDDKHDLVSKADGATRLRRTRSTGNIPKLVKESISKLEMLKQKTPKKKRAAAGRKCKSKTEGKNPSNVSHASPSMFLNPVIDCRKVELVARNLSSPLGISNAVLSEESCKKLVECPDYDTESNNNNPSPRKSSRRVSMQPDPVNGVWEAEAEARLEQERHDLELARRLQAEWNGPRAGRTTAKRQLCRQLTLTQLKKMKA